MKLKLDRIISIATLAALLVAIVLFLKRPAAVPQQPQVMGGTTATPPSIAPQQANQQVEPPAQRQTQPSQPWQAATGYSTAPQPTQNAPAPPSAKVESPIHSEEISAAVTQLLGASGAGLTPDSNVGDGMPNIKDQKVTYDGDIVHGQFLTEIAGKDVWITISGRMGQKDGYATFDPTEFKVGNIDVPVALVNPALQRKLAEERDRLKIAEPK
jgi:hypothetical protein